MIPVRSDRLILRNWRDPDRAAFHLLNADEDVMRFFPFRRSRAESDELFDRVRASIARKGYGFGAVELAATGACIGFIGIEDTDLVPFRPQGAVEIGWRLARPFWRRGFASEAAAAWLGLAFDRIGLDEVFSFAVEANRPSTSVMERIGMKRVPSGDFDHPRVPPSMPQLSRHILYRIGRDDWLRGRNRPVSTGPAI